MRLLVYGDLQATDGNETCYNQPTLPLQHYRVTKFFNDLKRIYDEHKCDGLIDLGDTTDDRSAIPVPTIDAVVAGIEQFPSDGYNVKLIGNHEQFHRNTTVHVGKLFSSRFNVVSNREIFAVGDYVAFFCSYPAHHEDLMHWLAQQSLVYKNNKKIIFGHFQVVGAAMNSGVALTGIPKGSMEPFDVGFLGHVHLAQAINERVHYVGSPFQQNFGEANQHKRVAVFDTDTGATTWVPMEGYPRYHIVDFKTFVEVANPETEDRYKVVLATHEEAEAFFNHPLSTRAESEYLYDLAGREQSAVAENQDWSFEGVLKRWIDQNPLEKTGLDVDTHEMLEIGVQIAYGKA